MYEYHAETEKDRTGKYGRWLGTIEEYDVVCKKVKITDKEIDEIEYDIKKRIEFIDYLVNYLMDDKVPFVLSAYEDMFDGDDEYVYLDN